MYLAIHGYLSNRVSSASKITHNDLFGTSFFTKNCAFSKILYCGDQEMFKAHLNDKQVVELLKYVYIEKKKKSSVALLFDVHRNTVDNLCKKYEPYIDEIFETYTDIDNVSDEKVLLAKYKKVYNSKIKDEDISAIKECCEKYLNCYISDLEYCENLCGYLCDLDDVVNFKACDIDAHDGWNMRAKRIRAIRRIRAVDYYRKNYKDVYEEYTQTHRYKTNPISYECFYKIARQFWINKDLPYETLGETVDKIYNEKNKIVKS